MLSSIRRKTVMILTLAFSLVVARITTAFDTRVHWFKPVAEGNPETIEAETSLDPLVADGLRALGWRVDLREDPGTGRHFGGVNAVTLNPDGSRTGYADPRRTNAAIGH
jgi:gamma-glutamyltranspeptidase